MRTQMPVQVDATYYASDLVVRILPTRGVGVRTPYHIALLLDTSGSMEGAPIAAVIRTLHLLIDRMEEMDMLTLIQYAGSASLLVECANMNTRAKTDIHRMVDRLTADGGTNMEEAIELLGGVSEGSPIDAVFLMTDGHVNAGITNATGLLRLLSARVASGTPINTLGFGTSHNAAMLRDMAVRSCGSYTYADATELIPAIIGDIVGGLIDMVGSNARLAVLPGGYCLELGVDVSRPEVYNVGPLIANKPQWVVFRGPFDPQGGPVQLMWIEDEIQQSCIVGTNGALDMMEMEEQVQRVHLVRTMTTVSEMITRRDYDGAISELNMAENRLAHSPAVGRSFILRLQAQVDEMLDDVRQQQEPMVDENVDMLTRMVSNVTALGTQHGFFLSRNTTAQDPDVISSPFSTPHQRQATADMTQRFQEPN